MRTMYSGELSVSYKQFYGESRADGRGTAHPWDPRAGQRNGLCGGAVPGHLFLTTGLHTGHVGLTVEVHDAVPPLDDEWEEVVEVSFRPGSPSTVVLPWGDGPLCDVDLTVTDYRVRYCGRGMDHTPDDEIAVLEGGEPFDHYLLQFWPAPPGEDRIVRQTSRSAAYWHEVAGRQPPPPSAEAWAQAERRRREDEERLEAARAGTGGNTVLGRAVAQSTSAWGRWPCDGARRAGSRAHRQG